MSHVHIFDVWHLLMNQLFHARGNHDHHDGYVKFYICLWARTGNEASSNDASCEIG